jgi:hypothetical protein
MEDGGRCLTNCIAVKSGRSRQIFQRILLCPTSWSKRKRSKKQAELYGEKRCPWILLGLMLDPENGGTTFLRNLPGLLPDYTALQIQHLLNVYERTGRWGEYLDISNRKVEEVTWWEAILVYSPVNIILWRVGGLLDLFCPNCTRYSTGDPVRICNFFITIPITRNYNRSQLFLPLCNIYTAYNHLYCCNNNNL